MTPIPATTFPRFTDLPFEIRWTIYELCLPTRVVDSAIVIELIVPGLYYWFGEQKPAVRYIVGKYTRMPTISRAVPEVYRKLRQHVFPPPKNSAAWNWISASHYPFEPFHDPRPIFFNPKSDILYISPRDDDFYADEEEEDQDLFDSTPYWLARSPDVGVAIDEWSFEILEMTPSIADYCFLGRKKCTIILSETRLVIPMDSIISSGLFGPWGEERTVLVDVDDLELIDYYDKKLNGQDIHPRKWPRRTWGYELDMPGGIRRYSSHGTVDFRRAWDEDSPVVSAEERAQLIARDKQEMLRRVKLVWLRASGCMAGLGWEDPELLPYERCPDLPPGWDEVFDEDHPTAKLWLDKLPAFSFAVRVYAQDLEECKRIREAQPYVATDYQLGQ